MSEDGAAFPAAEMLTEELAECLQNLLHAEGQLVKALAKMVKASRSPPLSDAFARHLDETQGQVERIQQVFKLIGVKRCRGQGIDPEAKAAVTRQAMRARPWPVRARLHLAVLLPSSMMIGTSQSGCTHAGLLLKRSRWQRKPCTVAAELSLIRRRLPAPLCFGLSHRAGRADGQDLSGEDLDEPLRLAGDVVQEDRVEAQLQVAPGPGGVLAQVR